jgi:hypothetical protein
MTVKMDEESMILVGFFKFREQIDDFFIFPFLFNLLNVVASVMVS